MAVMPIQWSSAKPASAHGALTERWKLAMLCVVGILLNTWLACNLFLPDAWYGRNDFLSFYTGAKLAGTAELYDRAATRDIHVQAVGETGEIQFGRLPYYAWLLEPLARLPYRTAYVTWEALSLAALTAFVALWPGVPFASKLLTACWSLPAFVAFFNGQEDLFLLLWLALAVRLLAARHALAAGIVLTLCASKYHLFTLVPLVILAQRRWLMGAGALIGAGSLAGISFAVAGSDWPARYYAVLTYPGINTSLAHMPNLHSLFGSSSLGLTLQIAAMLALAVAVYVAARASSSFAVPLSLAVASGILVGFHGYLHDCALLLPAILMFWGVARKRFRLLLAALASPLPWFLLQMRWPAPAVTQLLILTFAISAAWMLARRQVPVTPDPAP